MNSVLYRATVCFLLAAARAEMAAVPFVDSPCWREASNFALRLNKVLGNADLQTTTPDRDKACRLFTHTERRSLAIALMECRENERRAPTTVSASQLANGGGGVASQPGQFDCLAPLMRAKDTPTDVEQVLSGCLQKMDNFTFHLYVEHMNHIENLCFHVHSMIWQAKADLLITDLANTAADVTKHLEESSVKFDRLVSKQAQSLELQEQILKTGADLQTIVQSGNSRVHAAFDSMKTQVELEHEKVLSLFSDIFQGVNKLTSFQQYLKVKVLDVQSLALYAFLIYITHYVTSTVKTQGARAPLVLVWTIMLLIELAVLRLFSEDAEGNQRLYVGLARYGCCGLGLLVWIRCYIYYEDPYSRALTQVQSHMYVLEHKMDRYMRRSSSAAMNCAAGLEPSIVRRSKRLDS